jgi:hypothetical protein
LHLHLRANRITKVDIETDELTIGIFRFKRWEGRVDTETQLIRRRRRVNAA